MAVAAGAMFLIRGAGWLQRFEWMAGDWLQRLAVLGEPPDPRLEFVVLDQKSLDAGEAEFGLSWPWPREAYARAIRFLHRGGARVVFLDFLFSEPSLYGPADDQVLAEALRAGGNVYLPCVTRAAGPSPHPDSLAALGAVLPAPIVLSTEARIPRRKSVTLPIPEFMRAAAGLGDARFSADEDGVGRRFSPLVKVDGRLLPQFGLTPFFQTTRTGWIRLFSGRLELGGRLFPLDDRGNVVLRFPGDWKRYPRTSLVDVITSEVALGENRTPAVDPGRFRGKTVVIGSTAEGLFDLRKSPLESEMPGFFFSAAVWAAGESGRAYHEEWKSWLAWPLLLLLIFLGAVWGRLSFGWGVGGAAATLAAFAGTCVVLFMRQQVILEILSPAAGFLISFGTSLGLSYRRERRQKYFIRNAFTQIMSPALVEGLMQDPERLAVGGDLAEVSVYFSDLQGFTHFSEKMDPHSLVSLLNAYLGEMIETILDDFNGYVDKFIGDAVMAFWGAPLPDRNHAYQACQAALRNQEKLAKLRLRLRLDFPLRMRIGIHTGPVVVGMMGSPKKLNYTVIGDAVNLASRLEGANKVYGTEILISEATYRRVKEKVVARELDLLQVKGKTQPTRIYELVGLIKNVPPLRLRQIQNFQAAVELYQRRKFRESLGIFKRLLEESPGDAAVQLYVDRCRVFLRKPPPAAWNGVTVLKNK